MPSNPILDDVKDPELVIGLVGPAGVDLKEVIRAISDQLAELSYTVEEIRLSNILKDLPINKDLDILAGASEDTRIRSLMRAGDSLRNRVSRGDALALLAVSAIVTNRAQKTSDPQRPASRHAYILNSMKHDDEVLTLRKIYGKMFFLVSVYSPRAERVNALSKKISQSKHDPETNRYRSVAEELVELDANAGIGAYSQNVQDTFPLGDMFVRSTEPRGLRDEIKRLFEAWFRYPFHTPTRDEHGMFHAKAAALRSADLSRQVGCVITSTDGEILAVGCNEVPKPGGGAIWTGDGDDQRDFMLGNDVSAKMKHEIIAEIVGRFSKHKLLTNDPEGALSKDLTDRLLYGDLRQVLKGSRVTNIIEFGRIVHAEMAAIMDAARRGVALHGSVLYCTTFPCHMCARHIIASGISRVVYIEPYPKSAARDLYRNAISVDEEGPAGAVKFESFCGISPSRYIDIFSMPARKDVRGNIVAWIKSTSYPFLDQVYLSYLEAETAVLNFVKEHGLLFGIEESQASLSFESGQAR